MRMLIVNPIAGCGYALKVMEQVQSVLTARNLPFRVMRTEYPGYAAKLAREIGLSPSSLRGRPLAATT